MRCAILGIFFLFSGCATTTHEQTGLVQVNLLDQNGFSEVVTSKDKLAALEGYDFIKDLQPYKKVSRLYKEKDQKAHGVLTSYHSNGHVHQYLETQGAYARGAYREWHENGRQKIEAQVVGGRADLDPQSECTWVFDGLSKAWNEKGELEAEISYKRGQLAGLCCYYFPSGVRRSLERYENGKLEGERLEFFSAGELFKQEKFAGGQRTGKREIFFSSGERVAIEQWHEGALQEGTYFAIDGKKLGTVEKGEGLATYFSADGSSEAWTFREGYTKAISAFDPKGVLCHSWSLENGQRHGSEKFFYPNGAVRLEIYWRLGKIQGEQKSWYPNGQLESLRLMQSNRRSGPSTAWYENGQVMLIEEYEADRLIEGQYFRLGEDPPISRVRGGEGTATLFDKSGELLRRVHYAKGEPKVSK